METIHIASPSNSVRYPSNDAASVHSGQLTRDQEEHRRAVAQIKLRLSMEYARIEVVDGVEMVKPPTFAPEFMEILESTLNINSMEEFGSKLTSFSRDQSEGQHYLDRWLNMPTFNNFTLKLLFLGIYRKQSLMGIN